jgi:hypothetical protein
VVSGLTNMVDFVLLQPLSDFLQPAYCWWGLFRCEAAALHLSEWAPNNLYVPLYPVTECALPSSQLLHSAPTCYLH